MAPRTGLRNAQEGGGQQRGGHDVQHEGGDRRPRRGPSEEPAHEGAEREPGGGRHGGGQRRRLDVLLGMQFPDGDGDAGHDHAGADAVDDLAGEEPDEAMGGGEGDRAQHRDGDAGRQQCPAADTIGHPADEQQDGDHRRHVDREQEGDDAGAEAIAFLVDREERGGEVAAGEQEHLGGHDQPEAGAQRPRSEPAAGRPWWGTVSGRARRPVVMARRGASTRPGPGLQGAVPVARGVSVSRYMVASGVVVREAMIGLGGHDGIGSHCVCRGRHGRRRPYVVPYATRRERLGQRPPNTSVPAR